jgi:hypothetical protein
MSKEGVKADKASPDGTIINLEAVLGSTNLDRMAQIFSKYVGALRT